MNENIEKNYYGSPLPASLINRPSLRGTTPLDVAYSSLMDNTELALALRWEIVLR